jgi:tripartite ATP-independent transporter DctM subunit
LGSIFTGIATPTDAAAVGAFGSVACAFIYHKLNWANFKEAAYRTVITNGMVLWIIMGTSAFIAVYQALGAPQLIREILVALPLNPWVILIGIQATYFILGMFMDPIAIAMITVPIFLPVIKDFGFDTVWFGVLYVVNMEMAYLTPPFGGNLFYLRGVVPKGITMGDIYRSIWPFVVLQAAGLAIVMIFPHLILWLPNILIGK